MSALVSVIVPVYNAEFFIEDCINSIISQDFEGLEILISDDGSSDNTRVLLDKYIENDQIKIYLQEKNLGITDNCNFLLNKASGQYICFFAGDDVMLPNKISKQYTYMKSNRNLSFSYHLVDIFDTQSGDTIAITNHQPNLNFLDVGTIISQMGISASMSIMARKSMLPKDLFNSNFRYTSDWLMQIELAINGQVGYLDEVLCRYRKYGVNNGKSISTYEHEFLELLDFVKEKYPFLSKFCLKGKARYFLGKAFRVSGMIEKKRALRESINNSFSVHCFLLLLVANLPYSYKLFDFIYQKRFIIKSKI